jgi:hypothetical protein
VVTASSKTLKQNFAFFDAFDACIWDQSGDLASEDEITQREFRLMKYGVSDQVKPEEKFIEFRAVGSSQFIGPLVELIESYGHDMPSYRSMGIATLSRMFLAIPRLEPKKNYIHSMIAYLLVYKIYHITHEGISGAIISAEDKVTKWEDILFNDPKQDAMVYIDLISKWHFTSPICDVTYFSIFIPDFFWNMVQLVHLRLRKHHQNFDIDFSVKYMTSFDNENYTIPIKSFADIIMVGTLMKIQPLISINDQTRNLELALVFEKLSNFITKGSLGENAVLVDFYDSAIDSFFSDASPFYDEIGVASQSPMVADIYAAFLLSEARDFPIWNDIFQYEEKLAAARAFVLGFAYGTANVLNLQPLLKRRRVNEVMVLEIKLKEAVKSNKLY